MEEIGILALLEAKPGKGPDLHALLKSAREAAIAEQGTVNWFAFQISDIAFGIFDTFVDEDARIAHINGEITKALAAHGDEILAKDPDISTVDIVAAK